MLDDLSWLNLPWALLVIILWLVMTELVRLKKGLPASVGPLCAYEGTLDLALRLGNVEADLELSNASQVCPETSSTASSKSFLLNLAKDSQAT